MEACPRLDEPQRTRWKRPIKNPQRSELDLSDLTAVLSVEVRRRMIGTVHPDDDSVERGQARHRAIVGHSMADMATKLTVQGIRSSFPAVRLAQRPSSSMGAAGFEPATSRV